MKKCITVLLLLTVLFVGCGKDTAQQTQAPTEITKEAVYVNITAQEAKEIMTAGKAI